MNGIIVFVFGLLLVAPMQMLLGQTGANSLDGLTAEVVQSQAPAHSAVILEISDQGIRNRANGKEQTIALSQIRKLIFATRTVDKPVALPEPATIAVLSDGSQFACKQITFDGSSVVCQIDDQRSHKLETSVITSCQFQTLSAAQQTQWQAIVASRLSSDILVLIRSPEALDKIEGLIQRIEPQIVKFDFAGQAIDAPRAKLAGIRFFSKNPALAGNKGGAIVREKNGATWMAQSVSAKDLSMKAAIEVKLLCGSQIEIPIASVAEIDFSFGNMQFLAELEPLERATQKRIVGPELPEFNELFGPQVLFASEGDAATMGPGLQFLGAGSIVFRIPDGFQRLLGSVELSPDGPRFVPCRIRIFQEERQLVEKTLMDPRQPVAIDLAIEAGKRLKLVVDTDVDQPVGNVVLWKQLRFAK